MLKGSAVDFQKALYTPIPSNSLCTIYLILRELQLKNLGNDDLPTATAVVEVHMDHDIFEAKQEVSF